MVSSSRLHWRLQRNTKNVTEMNWQTVYKLIELDLEYKMEYEMMDNVLREIKEIAIKYNIRKVVLFGSRARGDNTLVSDYDIAVFGESLSAFDKMNFCSDVEEIETLKKIDIVFMDAVLTDDLLKNIKEDGVTIYE